MKSCLYRIFIAVILALGLFISTGCNESEPKSNTSKILGEINAATASLIQKMDQLIAENAADDDDSDDDDSEDEKQYKKYLVDLEHPEDYYEIVLDDDLNEVTDENGCRKLRDPQGNEVSECDLEDKDKYQEMIVDENKQGVSEEDFEAEKQRRQEEEEDDDEDEEDDAETTDDDNSIPDVSDTSKDARDMTTEELEALLGNPERQPSSDDDEDDDKIYA